MTPLTSRRPAGKRNRARARAHERKGADRRSAFGAKPEHIFSLCALCFASKVGRFASKIGRLASKRHTWHMERASGNALQDWMKGTYDTRAALPSGRSSSKNPALSQRLAVRSNRNRFWLPFGL